MDLWDNGKGTNIHIIGFQKEKREQGPKVFEEVIAEEFPNIGKETVKQVQEIQRIPGRINQEGICQAT